MKALRSLALALFALLGITGCLQVEKIVKLKSDGSGTIEETVVISKAFAEQMKQMTSGLGALGGDKPAAGAHPPSFNLMDEKKLKEAAGKMGEGVTFVSAKPVTTPTGEGFTAIYAFADIRKIKVSQDVGDSVPNPEGPGLSVKPKSGKSEPLTFEFAKGAPANLTINLPQPKPGDSPAAKKDAPAQPEGGEEMAMMMMKEMFKDMKMTVAIEFAGKIAQTNAEHVAGSRVTLIEMDFNKVLANPAKFKELSKAQPKSMEDAKVLLKGIDGIKAESQPKVTVKFQ